MIVGAAATAAAAAVGRQPAGRRLRARRASSREEGARVSERALPEGGVYEWYQRGVAAARRRQPGGRGHPAGAGGRGRTRLAQHPRGAGPRPVRRRPLRGGHDGLHRADRASTPPTTTRTSASGLAASRAGELRAGRRAPRAGRRDAARPRALRPGAARGPRPAGGGVRHDATPCPSPPAAPRRPARVYDVALLDLDGVVYVGPDAVPGVPEALAAARDAGHAARLRHQQRRPHARTTVAEHLTELGVPRRARRRDHQLPGRRHRGRRAARAPAPGCCPSAARAWRRRCAAAGLTVVERAEDEPAAVVQGYGREVGWAQLAEAVVAIRNGARHVATNTDATIPSPRGPLPGQRGDGRRRQRGHRAAAAGHRQARPGDARRVRPPDRRAASARRRRPARHRHRGRPAGGGGQPARASPASPTRPRCSAAGPEHRPDLLSPRLRRGCSSPHPPVHPEATGAAVRRLDGRVRRGRRRAAPHGGGRRDEDDGRRSRRPARAVRRALDPASRRRRPGRGARPATTGPRAALADWGLGAGSGDGGLEDLAQPQQVAQPGLELDPAAGPGRAEVQLAVGQRDQVVAGHRQPDVGLGHVGPVRQHVQVAHRSRAEPARGRPRRGRSAGRTGCGRGRRRPGWPRGRRGSP